jgi:arsenate reductase
MAEGLLRNRAEKQFHANSCGVEPKGVNPLAIEAMSEIGIDISGHRSKSTEDVFGKVPVDFAIFVCSSADERCPRLASFSGKRLHWPFEDPAAATGSHDEKSAVFRHVRDQIEARIIAWLDKLEALEESNTFSG